MAGIYIHIPFCKTRCIYCDFYSTTRMEIKDRYIKALCKELSMRTDYLKNEQIDTIYLGGGTPSQLTESDFKLLFNTLNTHYDLTNCHEITLEANPDDLTETYAVMLKQLPFNRISMGIQTFNNDMLKCLHRRHNAQQAINAVNNCRKAGFQNISIDLIYGLPGETPERWEKDLQQAIRLKVEHISAYHLIYEEGTPIYNMLHEGKIKEVNEDNSLAFFSTLIDQLNTAGYKHYEISNFCIPGYHSRHNSSYWHGIPYLGCGPSAHSFNRTSREWNISSLDDYIRGIENNGRIYELEELDLNTRYNERILTAMRTSDGLDLDAVQKEFGDNLYRYCLKMAAPYLHTGKVELTPENRLRITRQGIFTSDGIMSDLFYIDK